MNNISDTKKEYTFTVKNKAGVLVPNADRLIENIIYSNSGYKITVKMDSAYTSEYRKEVLWDFGDGEKVKGGQVEHYYKRPGRYTISATLFDSDRLGHLQDYTVDVVVKDLIPTMLRFDETSTKKEVKCSKIERIAKIECLISNITDAPLDVVVKRIFSKEKEENTSKGKSYFDVKDTLNFHMDKYWTTLKNDQVLYYNTNKVYQSDLKPSEVFNPSYTAIYYRLVMTKAKTLGLKFYQVLPYKDLDRQARQIKVLDHTSTVDNEVWSVYNIENVYDVSKLPQDAVYCGMRGFTDIFYKTDFINDVNTFSIFYDTEVGDITRQMYSAGNYTNITPLGLTVGTVLNEIKADNFKVALSGNYFLNDTITDIKISDTSSNIFIDPYLEGSLYNGLDITCYLMPVFYYTDEDDVKLADNSYYIPKDVQIRVVGAENWLTGNGKYGESSLVVLPNDNQEYKLKGWLYKIPIQLNNYIDVIINTETTSPNGDTVEIDIRLCQKPLRSLTDLVIPQEKVTEVNIDELLNAYMKHPMFLETPNTREFMRLYLNSFVDKVQTESNNFIDNVANVKTCYLSHLISHLQMMGEDVYEYDNSHLEGINDLKKFSRLLSMNHSDLIGHTTSLDWDVEVNMDYKGKNVGRKLKPDDVLTLCIPTTDPDTEDYYINFAKVTHINGEKVDGDGCNLIVRDKFANKTEFIHFRDYLNDCLDDILYKNEGKYATCSTVDDVKAIDPDYLTNDIVAGVWSESLSNLEDGEEMFQGCNNLTSFNTDLPNLTKGKNMFSGCCLDKKSIKKIASSINELSVNPSEDDENKGVIHLGIDSRLKDDSEVKGYLEQIRAKNWTVEKEYNVNTFEPGKVDVTIRDYNNNIWGWNLLLPDGFKTMIDKIKKYKAEIKLLEEQEKDSSLKDYEKVDIREKIRIYENEVSLLYKRKGDVLQGYYNFYLLKPQRDVIRQGNFISEDYITDEIADPNEWGRQWGITHDILMKILLTNAKLLSRRDVIPDRGYHYEEYWETAIINESKNFNNFNESDDKLDIKVGDKIENDRYDVTGSMTIRGKIYSEGTNTLEVRLQNCLIDREDSFSLGDAEGNEISGKEIYIEVVGRDITPSTHIINLYGDSRINKENSELQITISGSIDSPVINVTGEIYYNPNIIKKDTEAAFTICGGDVPTDSNDGTIIQVDSQFVTAKGEVDTEFEKRIPFKMPVKVNANISGGGEHKAEITIDEITFFNIDEPKEDENVDGLNEDDTEPSKPVVSFTNYDKLLLSFHVDKDGNIVNARGEKTDEDNQITTGKTYIRGSYTDIYNIYGTTNYYKGIYSLYEELGEDNTQKGVWIDVGIYGSTKEIKWSLRCGSDSDIGGDNKFDFVYDYPSTGASYKYAYTDKDIIDGYYTKSDFSITLKPDGQSVTPTIDNLNLELSKLSEGVYRLHVRGVYKGDCTVDKEKVWSTKKDIDQTVDISVDGFGNIYSYVKGDEEYTEKEFFTEFYAFEAGESYNSNLDENSCPVYVTDGNFNIKFELSGNIINDAKLTLKATQGEAYGIYAGLFKDFVKNFDTSSGESSDKIKVKVENSNAELEKITVSFIDAYGMPYNKPIYVTSIGDHSVDQVRMKIEFYFKETIVTKDENENEVKTVEYTTSTYVINDFSSNAIFKVDTGGNSHIWQNTTKALRETDNYYTHVFKSINFEIPQGATAAYDISDGIASADKTIIIGSEFSIYALNLTLIKKNIKTTDVSTIVIPSPQVGKNLGMYKAQCTVDATSQFFEPDENGEVISIYYTIDPEVIFIQTIDNVDNYHKCEVLERVHTAPLQKYIVKKIGDDYIIVDNSNEAKDITYNVTYNYIDGDEEDDKDGDVNYIINLALKPSLTFEDGKFVLLLLESNCHLDVIERAFNNKPHTIDWKRDTEDERLEGTTTLNCYSVLSEDGNETVVTISLAESSENPLRVCGVTVDSDNIILSSDSDNVIILNSDMSGKGTITIQASQYENGKSCELIQNITITYTNGKASYEYAKPQISFKDDSYKIKPYNGSWYKEENEEDNTVVTGCYTISGKNGSEYHGIKGEEFVGKLNICNPKINGVLLDVASITIDGKDEKPTDITIDDLKLTTAKIQLHDDSSNKDDSFEVDSSNEDERLHEIARPVPVNIKLKKNDWTLEDNFEIYRNINDDDMVNETQDVFELNVSRPYGDFSWIGSSLAKTTVDLGKSPIIDTTKYDELNIEKTEPEVVGNCVITPKFHVTITETPVDETVSIKDSSGKFEVEAEFGTLTINGVTLTVPTSTYSVCVDYDENGNVYVSDDNVNTVSFSFSDNANKYTLTGDIEVSGNVTDSNTFTWGITNLQFATKIVRVSETFIITGYSNDEMNKVDFGGVTSFNVDFSFNATYGKTSKAFLNLIKGSNAIYKINGLELKNEPTIADIKVYEDGGFTQTITFDFWDSLELVSISGNLVLRGDIDEYDPNTNKEYTISITPEDVKVHAKSIDIEEKTVNPTDESVSESFKVTYKGFKTDDGELYNNGKLGKNSTVNVKIDVFKVNEVEIGNFTITNESVTDESYDKNIILEFDENKDINPVTYTYSGESIGGAITFDCVCEISQTVKTDDSYTIGAKTTVNNVTFNDVSCKVETTDGWTVRKGENGEDNKVGIRLGKDITYYAGANEIVWEAVTLTNSDTKTVPMTGTTVNYSDTITYEKIVDGDRIAYKKYTFTWSGTVVENDGSLEGLSCKVTGPVEQGIKPTPQETYTFVEGGLSGSLVVSSQDRLIDETLTFTLKGECDNIELDLALNSDGDALSWEVTPNFDNDGDGSFDNTSKKFTLTDDDNTIEVTGSISVEGDVINGFTITVKDIFVKDNRENNYISYTNDGNYRIARLKALTKGDNLFRNQSIESFGATMPKLTTARNMFRGCSNLTNFASNMPNLTDASNMFNGCYNLTTFSGMLTNLTKAENMFRGCNLNEQSVKNIINQLSNGENKGNEDIEIITIGINPYKDDGTEYDEEDVFMKYLIANEYITNRAGQKWKLKIDWRRKQI